MTLSTIRRFSGRGVATSPRALFGALALSGLASTIALIMFGSVVRVTGHGLGCPDWPLCHGQVVPPFILGAWVEFTHRLLGGVVIVQALALIWLAWRHLREDRWLYRSAGVALVVIAFQVVLGGIHVIYELPRWSGWIHTGTAMLVAGVLAGWVALSQRSLRAFGRRAMARQQGRALAFWTVLAAGVTYLLLLSGSLVTRTGASLVCPAFPACGLSTVPPSLQMLVNIQLLHRVLAFLVALLVVVVVWHLLRGQERERANRAIALALLGLLASQFALGMANVWLAIPMWSRVLHLGTGAAIWSLLVLLAVSLLQGREAGRAHG